VWAAASSTAHTASRSPGMGATAAVTAGGFLWPDSPKVTNTPGPLRWAESMHMAVTVTTPILGQEDTGRGGPAGCKHVQ
jgi:hypothetical protein